MATLDRLAKAFARAVEGVTAPIDYLAAYVARVVAQNTDGSVDVQPDDPRLPGMQSVPLRLGVPGLSATVPAGARVYVQFEDGDPGAPMATLWGPTSGVSLVLNGGTKNVARVDDTVGSSTLMAAWMTAVGGVARGINPATPAEPGTIGSITSGTPALKA